MYQVDTEYTYNQSVLLVRCCTVQLALLFLQNIYLLIQFIDLVNPENSKCVQCDGTGYDYVEETGQCIDPQGQFVDKR